MDRRSFMTASAAIGGIAGLSACTTSAATGRSHVPGTSKFTGEVLYSVDYQERDEELVDYGFYELESLAGLSFRGPAIDLEEHEGYITCIGAAQTLGVFVDNPYPQLISQKYGLPVWNLGIGGAHPGFFLEHPKLFEYINKSKLVILQVMTGRCSENDRIGKSRVSAAGYDLKHNENVSASVIWNRILRENPETAGKLVEQSRSSWRRDLELMLQRIDVPVIHFWFSPKQIKKSALSGISGSDAADIARLDAYPQFISEEDIAGLDMDMLATCHSDRNMRFPLRSRRTGKILNHNWGRIRHKIDFDWYETHNLYYPSPEMHWDAATELIGFIDRKELI